MEALLSTQITKTELLLSKLLPYQVLGTFVMVLCMFVTTFVLGVPYRGSLGIVCHYQPLFGNGIRDGVIDFNNYS